MRPFFASSTSRSFRARTVRVLQYGARQALKVRIGLLPNLTSATRCCSFVRMTQALTQVPCQWYWVPQRQSVALPAGVLCVVQTGFCYRADGILEGSMARSEAISAMWAASTMRLWSSLEGIRMMTLCRIAHKPFTGLGPPSAHVENVDTLRGDWRRR